MSNNLRLLLSWLIFIVSGLEILACDGASEKPDPNSGLLNQEGTSTNADTESETITDVEEVADTDADTGSDADSDVEFDSDTQDDTSTNVVPVEDTESDGPSETDEDIESDEPSETDTETEVEEEDTDYCGAYCYWYAECGPDGCGGTCGLGCDATSGCNLQNRQCSPVCDTDCPVVTWITIEGGRFLMGSDEFPNAIPVHEVAVPTFQMTKSEITVS